MVWLLETLVWQKTKDATKKIPQHKPKLFTPDFMPNQSPPGEISKGAEVHTTDDIRAILDRARVSK